MRNQRETFTDGINEKIKCRCVGGPIPKNHRLVVACYREDDIEAVLARINKQMRKIQAKQTPPSVAANTDDATAATAPPSSLASARKASTSFIVHREGDDLHFGKSPAELAAEAEPQAHVFVSPDIFTLHLVDMLSDGRSARVGVPLPIDLSLASAVTLHNDKKKLAAMHGTMRSVHGGPASSSGPGVVEPTVLSPSTELLLMLRAVSGAPPLLAGAAAAAAKQRRSAEDDPAAFSRALTAVMADPQASAEVLLSKALVSAPPLPPPPPPPPKPDLRVRVIGGPIPRDVRIILTIFRDLPFLDLLPMVQEKIERIITTAVVSSRYYDLFEFEMISANKGKRRRLLALRDTPASVSLVSNVLYLEEKDALQEMRQIQDKKNLRRAYNDLDALRPDSGSDGDSRAGSAVAVSPVRSAASTPRRRGDLPPADGWGELGDGATDDGSKSARSGKGAGHRQSGGAGRPHRRMLTSASNGPSETTAGSLTPMLRPLSTSSAPGGAVQVGPAVAPLRNQNLQQVRVIGGPIPKTARVVLDILRTDTFATILQQAEEELQAILPGLDLPATAWGFREVEILPRGQTVQRDALPMNSTPWTSDFGLASVLLLSLLPDADPRLLSLWKAKAPARSGGGDASFGGTPRSFNLASISVSAASSPRKEAAGCHDDQPWQDDRAQQQLGCTVRAMVAFLSQSSLAESLAHADTDDGAAHLAATPHVVGGSAVDVASTPRRATGKPWDATVSPTTTGSPVMPVRPPPNPADALRTLANQHPNAVPDERDGGLFDADFDVDSLDEDDDGGNGVALPPTAGSGLPTPQAQASPVKGAGAALASGLAKVTSAVAQLAFQQRFNRALTGPTEPSGPSTAGGALDLAAAGLNATGASRFDRLDRTHLRAIITGDAVSSEAPSLAA